MINLLPPSERRALRREYRTRVGVLAATFLLVFEATLAFLFFPTVYGLWLSTSDASLQLQRARTSVPADIAGIESQIVDLKKKLDLMRGEDDIRITRYLSAIAQVKPVGVVLSGVALDVSGDKPVLVLKGYAERREDLTTFRARLRADATNFSGAEIDAKYLLREPIDFSSMRLILRP